jgi:hypothetical protein
MLVPIITRLRLDIPIPLLLALLPSSIAAGDSALMVEVDVDRPNEFFKGARWVSLSSASLLVLCKLSRGREETDF